MLSMTRLNAGFLVGGEHKILGAKKMSLPETLVEIEEGSGLFHKPGIPRKDPGSMPPRTNRVFADPTPIVAATDLRHQPLIANFLSEAASTYAQPGLAL